MNRAGLRVRQAARLLACDRRGRVWLFPFQPHGADGGIAYWFTPGGGVEAGESVADAARRECQEELGYALADPGEAIARRQFALTLLSGEQVWADEYYFVVDLGDHQPHDAGWQADERQVMGQGRWFDAAMLAAPPQPVFPEDLSRLLAVAREGWED